MKTNLGYNAETRIVDWKNKGNHLCFSCDKEKCNGFDILFHRKDYDSLTLKKKIRIVKKCNGYQEQTFTISKEHLKELIGFVETYCYASCAGKHNISQGGEGFFETISEVSKGIAYCLTHRKCFNDLSRNALLWDTENNSGGDLIGD